MHGLINRSLQSFLVETQGTAFWTDLAQAEGLDPDGLDIGMSQNSELPYLILDRAAQLLNRNHEEILEDLGTYLVSHPTVAAVRRLMRFSGRDFHDFVAALPDLRPRVRMAVPTLLLPNIEVAEVPGGFEIALDRSVPGFEYVLVGLIRAMADDYGALAHVEITNCNTCTDVDQRRCLNVIVLDSGHSAGRDFSLVEAS